MKLKLLLLIPFTIVMAVSAGLILQFGVGFPWISGFFTIGGIYGIVAVVRDHIQYTMVYDTLIIEQAFKTARAINLNAILQWEEFGFNIRGQKRSTIILFLDNEEKVIVDNSKYSTEFEQLSSYLVQNHLKLKRDHVSTFPHENI